MSPVATAATVSYSEEFALPVLRMPKYTALRLQDEKDVTSQMLHQARRYPLLKPHEEAQIAKVLQDWRELQWAAAEANSVEPAKLQDLQLASFAQTSGMNVKEALHLKRQGTKARELLINCNQRFAIKLAKQYQHKYNTRHLKLVDLIQAGKIGLIKAVDRFDIKAGCKFSTYAFHWIRQSLGEICKTQERTIRFPTHIEERRGKTFKAAAKLQADTADKQPTISSIAEAASLNPAKVKACLCLPIASVSTNLLVGQGKTEELGALLADSRSSQSPIEEVLEVVAKLVATLSHREQLCLKLFYGLDEEALSKPEIANRLGITMPAASYSIRTALEKLRTAAAQMQLTGADFLD